MRRLLMLMIVLIALAPFMGARAGKPKPTPYPAPNVQVEAYPPPGSYIPPEYPNAPDEFCDQPMEVCAWGYFNGRWWISINYMDFDLVGTVCIMSMTTSKASCFPVYPHGYDGVRTFYKTSIFNECGSWMIYYASLGGVGASEIRQPNNYRTICNFINPLRKG